MSAAHAGNKLTVLLSAPIKDDIAIAAAKARVEKESANRKAARVRADIAKHGTTGPRVVTCRPAVAAAPVSSVATPKAVVAVPKVATPVPKFATPVPAAAPKRAAAAKLVWAGRECMSCFDCSDCVLSQFRS